MQFIPSKQTHQGTQGIGALPYLPFCTLPLIAYKALARFCSASQTFGHKEEAGGALAKVTWPQREWEANAKESEGAASPGPERWEQRLQFSWWPSK